MLAVLLLSMCILQWINKILCIFKVSGEIFSLNWWSFYNVVNYQYRNFPYLEMSWNYNFLKIQYLMVPGQIISGFNNEYYCIYFRNSIVQKSLENHKSFWTSIIIEGGSKPKIQNFHLKSNIVILPTETKSRLRY